MIAQHDSEIEHNFSHARGQQFRAACDCGWRGRWWLTLRQAQRDEADHATRIAGRETR